MAFQAPTTSWLQTTYQRFITVFKAPVCSLEMLEESCDHDVTMADSWGGIIGGASSWQGCWKKIQAVAGGPIELCFFLGCLRAVGAWGLYTTRGLSPFFAPAYAVEEMRQPNKVGVLLFSKFFASPQKTLVKWQIRRRKSQALSRENSDLYLSIHAWICLFTYHFCAHVWTQNMHIHPHDHTNNDI